MSRTPSVWFWKQKEIYCTTINGKRIRLSTNRREAGNKLKELLRQEHKPISSTSVAAVLDDFIGWCHQNRAQRTADRYNDFCSSFAKSCGRIAVDQLHSGQVTEWINENPQWNSTTKRNAITAIVRAFNWAKRNSGLKSNPIAGMEKPKAQPRTSIVTPTDFEAILKELKKDDPFRQLLIVSYDSFCRPQEVKQLEARHVEADKSRAVLPTGEGKGGRVRAIYFPTDRSMKIILRLVKEHREGPLFRNRRGNQWTAFAVNCRFRRLKEKMGSRFNHYAFRRGGITRALVRGVDSHTVAQLAGHSSTKMIDEHYSRVADDHAYMLENAKRTT